MYRYIIVLAVLSSVLSNSFAGTNYTKSFADAICNIETKSLYDTSETVTLGRHLLKAAPNCNSSSMTVLRDLRCSQWFDSSMKKVFISLRKTDRYAAYSTGNPTDTKDVENVVMSFINSVLYIAYSSVNYGDDKKIRNRLSSMELDPKNQIKLVVLDLRNNFGGFVFPAYLVSDIFIAHGDIATLDYAEENVLDKVFMATPEDSWMEKVPIALVTNGPTASSAEIIARALLENNRASVHIGATTVGKNVFQSVVSSKADYSYNYIAGKVLSPSGHWHGEEGIIPTHDCAPPHQSHLLHTICDYAYSQTSAEAQYSE